MWIRSSIVSDIVNLNSMASIGITKDARGNFFVAAMLPTGQTNIPLAQFSTPEAATLALNRLADQLEASKIDESRISVALPTSQ